MRADMEGGCRDEGWWGIEKIFRFPERKGNTRIRSDVRRWWDFNLRRGFSKRKRAASDGEKLVSPVWKPTKPIMKITRINRNGERREALLKEYFLTASLIALLKRAGEQAAAAMPQRAPALAPVRVRR